MDDYRPNSHRFKEEQKLKQNSAPAAKEQKKIEKVVSGKAKVRKRGESGKFKDLFTSEDAANIASFAKNDVLIPSLKKAISDIIKTGIDMILYPNGGAPNRNNSKIPYISYDKRYGNQSTYQHVNSPVRQDYNFNHVVVDTQPEAYEVLDRMEELIETYGIVSVADMYELAGIAAQHTDNKYGWTSIRMARVTCCPDGWVIEMPRASAIN